MDVTQYAPVRRGPRHWPCGGASGAADRGDVRRPIERVLRLAALVEFEDGLGTNIGQDRRRRYWSDWRQLGRLLP